MLSAKSDCMQMSSRQMSVLHLQAVYHALTSATSTIIRKQIPFIEARDR